MDGAFPAMKTEMDAAVGLLEGEAPDAVSAIGRCNAALGIETEEGTPEREALLKLLEACTLWSEGDMALAEWRGTEALEKYEDGQDAAGATYILERFHTDNLGNVCADLCEASTAIGGICMSKHCPRLHLYQRMCYELGRSPPGHGQFSQRRRTLLEGR